MIAATEPEEFIPFGREYCSSHPGNSLLCTPKSVKHVVDLPLAAFREIAIESNAKSEFWEVRRTPGHLESADHDEELYSKGNTLVWSRGCQGQARVVQKSFTVDSPILQAQWITFWLQGNKPDADDAIEQQQETQPVDPVPSVCVSQGNSLIVFAEEGDEFAVSLPFEISKMWPINRGMLLERSVSQLEISSPKRGADNLPTLFSLLHPLDEPAPVICKSGVGMGMKINFMSDYTQNVVFTSKEPSLIVTFDTAMGLHSVWLLRQARTEEVCVTTKLLNMTTATSAVTTPHHHSTCSSGTLAGLSASAHSRLSASSMSPANMSPFRSYPSRTASPLMFSSRPQSPAMSVMATLSRSQSPTNSMINSPASGAFYSPAGRFSWSPAQTTALNTTYGDVSEPLTPDLCMDHCWTESVTGQRAGILGKATKVFLTSDLCDQHYLVYLIEPRRQLKIVQFTISTDTSQLVFGDMNTLPAKDAVPVKSLNVMVVLDLNGSMILYTGLIKMVKVHVSGILPTTLSGSSGSMPRPSTPLDFPMMPQTSSRPSSAAQIIMDEVVLLSPVPDMGDSSKLHESMMSDDFAFQGSGGGGKHVTALMDPVANRFTLELSDGTMLRTSLPQITSSPLINLCLDAIKYIVPTDIALQVLSKWYTTHNAPGGPSSQSEWIKFSECLLGLMGYDTSKLGIIQQHDIDNSMSPVVAAKKHKASGLEEDWEFLLASSYHQDSASSLLGILGINNAPSEGAQPALTQAQIDPSAPLFQYIPALLYALHLVYEEMKLDRSQVGCLHQMAILLCQIARDLDWMSYVDYYFRCHQTLGSVARQHTSQVSPEHRSQMLYPVYLCNHPPSIYGHIYNMLKGNNQEPYPCLPDICQRSQEIVILYSLYLGADVTSFEAFGRILNVLAEGNLAKKQSTELQKFLQTHPGLSNTQRVVLFMTDKNITLEKLNSLPFGVLLPLLEVIHQCHENPPSNWPEGAYVLMGRQDLSAQAKLRESGEKVVGESVPKTKAAAPTEKESKESKKEENDGMEHLDDELLRLRFPDDLRIQEVRRLLQSSRPARISLVQKPEVSDHDFIEEQEMRLLMVSQRTMALPVGRGMFTLCTSRAVVTETLPIPKLNLGGRAPPRNQTINFLHIDVPSNIHHWPLFHNGVAAGLKIAPGCSQIDSTWIVYNKPQGSELTYDHAGFLMALGLNAHLSNLTTLKVHDYLCKGHEITSVGLLLGLAAAKRGTMDVSTTKMLSIHIAALLPPTSTELDVPHIVQVAAIMGVGLVYQGTAHRHIAEVLLGEIGRPPGPELENCTDRESYSLTAGLALGMVMLGRGSDAVGLSDLNMADQLYHYMAGGHKKQPAGAHREMFKSPCYQIKEGDQVNIDVTSPGATLALGLMFFKTGNRAVAQWLTAPDTQFLLDFVKPDFLLLRTISRGLVLWEDVRPTSDWIQSNVPEIVKRYAFVRSSAQDELDGEIDFQTMSQAECNILAGACLVLGLRFAGSANNSAFETLLHYANRCYSLSTQPAADLVGKSTIETCLNAVMLSLALVMAGTGNLKVLRLTRQLHCRISVDVPYGSHMAIHMAIGLLFLGGGRYTLSTSGPAIAALLCSIYPRFPENSSDNRYHLQALRHLYVLAAEPRLILPKDVDSCKPCYAPIEIVFKGSSFYDEKTVQMLAPCIIPELKHLKKITVMGPRYLQIILDVEKDAETLKSIFEAGGMVYVKQRAGHLSYEEDPKGYHSHLAHSFTQDGFGYHANGINSKAIRSFTSDPKILTFAEYFCREQPGIAEEDGFNVNLASYLHECVTKEKPHLLPMLAEIHQAMKSVCSNPSPYLLWQIKLLLAYYDFTHARVASDDYSKASLVNAEMCATVSSQLELTLETWLQDNEDKFVRYLIRGQLPDSSSRCLLFCFLLFHDIPSHMEINQIPLMGCSSLPEVCDALQNFNMPVSGLMHILNALQTAR